VQNLEESATLSRIAEEFVSKLSDACCGFRIVAAVPARVGVLSVPLADVVCFPNVKLNVRMANVQPGRTDSLMSVRGRLRNLDRSEVHNEAHELLLTSAN